MALELINKSWLESDREDRALSALHLLREFRLAERGTRESLRSDLKINNNDLSALRFIREASADGPVGALMLGRHLGITSASTTALVNRMVAAGYLVREPDPRDRRAVVLTATQRAVELLDSSLQRQVGALLTAAGDFDDDELATVERFLTAVIEALKI
ncbi:MULTISPECIES: MarR family transcriptional regulator [Arthrobacter]|uniref:MarR family transcriptional regulator n=2 Tax=Arthrobacter TaxID=1663 RepID=A0ABU9KJ99_9MICC|nr:MarR family transcriptional regulator [Arthrobacter sp. YJM1]MDP5226792.1 MarR family transcriptional regulator [Arthrobacter sp. YJM1]